MPWYILAALGSVPLYVYFTGIAVRLVGDDPKAKKCNGSSRSKGGGWACSGPASHNCCVNCAAWTKQEDLKTIARWFAPAYLLAYLLYHILRRPGAWLVACITRIVLTTLKLGRILYHSGVGTLR